MNGLLWEYVTERINLVWAIKENLPEALMWNLKSRGCTRVPREYSIRRHSIRKGAENTAQLYLDN